MTALSPMLFNDVMAQSILYGSDNSGVIFTIDVSNGVGATVGPTFSPFLSTEIECTSDGSACYLQGSDGSFSIQAFDPTIPVLFGLPISDALSFNGLEYVGTTLYGTGVLSSCGPSTLHTINPVTGVTVPIGPTNTGRPMSGLAYDTTSNVMYGIDGCGVAGPSSLWTVDLSTGQATSVGNTGIKAGSLEFGPDGDLYAGGDTSDGGNLYRINTNDGTATLVGPTGFKQVTGMTLISPQSIVAGELVPLNTTALFISSLSSSMIWMAPAIIGIAGVGVYIKSKKN